MWQGSTKLIEDVHGAQNVQVVSHVHCDGLIKGLFLKCLFCLAGSVRSDCREDSPGICKEISIINPGCLAACIPPTTCMTCAVSSASGSAWISIQAASGAGGSIGGSGSSSSAAISSICCDQTKTENIAQCRKAAGCISNNTTPKTPRLPLFPPSVLTLLLLIYLVFVNFYNQFSD